MHSWPQYIVASAAVLRIWLLDAVYTWLNHQSLWNPLYIEFAEA